MAVERASQWLWAPSVWLPPNVTWESFEQEREVGGALVAPDSYARFSDLLYPLPVCLAMSVLRCLVERAVFRPLGLWLGLREGPRRPPPPVEVLEAAYSGPRGMARGQVEELARQTNLSYLQVERWLRQRRQVDQPTTLSKFQETGWRWTFYLSALVYGAWCLWPKPWFADIHHCWIDYPFHQVDTDVRVYYIVELSFYWSLMISQFFDVKRKDFWEMFIHHNVTIALISLSWVTHFTRVGTLVILVHDCSDHLLELAKMLKYAKCKLFCDVPASDVMFILFAITWVVTRCGVFPAWILYSTLVDAGTFLTLFPLYYVFLVLLGLLQLLNLVWTFMLVKAIQAAINDQEIKDTREDSDASSLEEDENYNSQLKKLE